MKELFRGAEAVIYEVNEKTLLKKRARKSYRIKELDEKLRKARTKNEINLLRRASSAGVCVPKVSGIEKYSFKMDYVKGELLKNYINALDEKELNCLFMKVGRGINALHGNNIIHGDLTTSNMILSNGKVFFIDFGLGSLSCKAEDKAVDLHLIKQALIAKHNRVWRKCFETIKENYNDAQVLERLKSVERRSRKKS